MNPEVNQHPPTSCLSDEIKSTVANVKTKAHSSFETYEEKVRQSPKKAMLIALGAGYCLNVLPVGTLISVPLRLTAFLAKPTLLALGALKLYELAEEKARK